MKISVLTPNMSGNCFGRAWLLAKLLQRHYDIEVVGPVFGDGIWKPLEKECNFRIKKVKGYSTGQFDFKKMLKLIRGDVIYASKPLITSYGVGLVKKITTGKPLVLDIDDWEIGFGKEFYDSLVWYKKINDFRLSIKNLTSYYYTVILDKFIRLANDVTVSGNILQTIYGGTIVWHGRDVYIFNPEKYNRKELREKYLSHKERNLFIIGFIGTPRPHKGVDDLVDAMSFLNKEYFGLIIWGMNQDGYCLSLNNRVTQLDLKDKVFFFPEQSFSKLPEILSLMDVVVIPQRQMAQSYGQVPAKIFDAMAMGKPIIATNVGDIFEIINGCGWLIEPKNPKKLAETIQYIFNNPSEAKSRGKRAREKCIRKYSWEVMEEKLKNIFDKFKRFA